MYCSAEISKHINSVRNMVFTRVIVLAEVRRIVERARGSRSLGFSTAPSPEGIPGLPPWLLISSKWKLVPLMFWFCHVLLHKFNIFYPKVSHKLFSNSENEEWFFSLTKFCPKYWWNLQGVPIKLGDRNIFLFASFIKMFSHCCLQGLRTTTSPNSDCTWCYAR